MNKDTLKNMNNIAEALIALGNEVKQYAKKGQIVEAEMTMTNTGIVEGPICFSDNWKTIYSLGAKDITINLSFPNTRTLQQAMKEEKIK